MYDCKYNIEPKHRRIGFHVEINHQFLSIFLKDKCHLYVKRGGRRHKHVIIYILMGFSQSTINAVIINWLGIETALINGRKFTFKIHVQTL